MNASRNPLIALSGSRIAITEKIKIIQFRYTPPLLQAFPGQYTAGNHSVVQNSIHPSIKMNQREAKKWNLTSLSFAAPYAVVL